MNKAFKDYKILVVGAGVMGSGIAQVLAANGLFVYMADLSMDYLQKSMERIDDNINYLQQNDMADEKYREAVHANIHMVTNDMIPEITSDLDFVFEVIFENKDAKRALYKTLSDHCPENCIFASNTSGMDVFSVCKDVLKNPGRLVIAHWFNPPHLMKLIEVVKGPETSDETAEITRGLLEYIGKKPSVLNHFIPGFIVNRIATVINRELYYMIEQGWISPMDAENAIKYTNGLRFSFEGPLALWDYVGLEIPSVVARDILPSLCKRTDSIPMIDKMIAEGRTGVKADQGMLKGPSYSVYTEKRNRRIMLMSKILEEFDKEDRKDAAI